LLARIHRNERKGDGKVLLEKLMVDMMMKRMLLVSGEVELATFHFS